MRPIYLLNIFFLVLISCSNDENSFTPPSQVYLTFNHLMDNVPVQLNNQVYKNANQDEFLLEEWRYYISNIQFIQNNGKSVELTDSYHLISVGNNKTAIEIDLGKIDDGIYQELVFSIGVDQERNASIDNIGDLDPTNNMAWDWNTGYKFIRLSGKYFHPSGTTEGLIYHIGTDKNYRTIHLRLEDIKFNSEKNNTVQVNVELSQLFKNPHTIHFEENHVVMFDEIASKVADNYAQEMFTLHSVKN